MRICCGVSGREAKPVKGPNDAEPVYKCFPPGGRKNRDGNARKFRSITDAAGRLAQVVGGGIRVARIGNGPGQGSAILNSNLVIEHDDGRKEHP